MHDARASRPTLADVARLAEVSTSTASVVFSGKAVVSEPTRERVLAAASELGYAGPDPRAASLRRGRSGIVAAVFEGQLRGVFADPVIMVTLDGLASGLADEGASILLMHESRPHGAGADVEASGTRLGTAPIDAAVLFGCSGTTRESLATLSARGIPVVVIEGDAGGDVPRIDLDNREAPRELAHHLRGLGHEKVAIVTLPLTAARTTGPVTPKKLADATVAVTRDRLAAIRDIYPDAPAYAAAGSTIDAGAEIGRDILARADRPTAVVGQSDLIAAGIVRAAEELGLRVPQDLSVVGFDGASVDGIAPQLLTTMVQPAFEKGRAAGAAIAALLRGEATASLRFTSVFRQGTTTGPAPSDL